MQPSEVFARIDIFGDLDGAAPDWAILEASTPCSPYQTLAWNRAWCATVGVAQRATPLIVVARNERDVPIALWPLARSKFGALSVAQCLGGKDSNTNLVLFRDGQRWSGAALQRLFDQVAAEAAIDLFVFRNQAERWAGRPNPMLLLPHQPSPSACHAATLGRDQGGRAELRLSKHARKLLRQKDARLRTIGAVSQRAASSAAESDALVATYVAWRQARAGSTGAPLPTAFQAAFLRQAAAPAEGRVAMVLYALSCGADTVAIFGGATHQGRFSGMVLAFDPRPDIARCSPGELLVRGVMDSAAAQGLTAFDLGIGEARYKDTFCDVVEPLFDCFVGVTPRGRLTAAALCWLGSAKRRIKASKGLSARVNRLRATVQRLRGRAFSRP